MKSLEFKVGLFVLACMAVVAAMTLQVNNDPSVTGKSKRFDAILENANGIVKNSNVRSTGGAWKSQGTPSAVVCT